MKDRDQVVDLEKAEAVARAAARGSFQEDDYNDLFDQAYYAEIERQQKEWLEKNPLTEENFKRFGS